MAENIVELLTDVADAIREKKGSNEPINAQNFANEIKNLPSGSSPFAVDFGEEIASGNLAFINALQEDIDYYNEIQRKRAAGEVTDEELLSDWVFKSKIAWYPKGMSKPNIFEGFRNLKLLEFTFADTNVTNIKAFNNIDCLILGNKNSYYGLFQSADNFIKKVSFAEDYLQHFNDVSMIYALNNAVGIREVDFKFIPMKDCRSIISNKWLQSVKGLNLSSAISVDGNNTLTNLIVLELKGLGLSLSLANASILSVESVKYILDHCQDKSETYSLTLHADVKTAFLAKCDEDAEYAASLASANAKGLTLA